MSETYRREELVVDGALYEIRAEQQFDGSWKIQVYLNDTAIGLRWGVSSDGQHDLWVMRAENAVEELMKLARAYISRSEHVPPLPEMPRIRLKADIPNDEMLDRLMRIH